MLVDRRPVRHSTKSHGSFFLMYLIVLCVYKHKHIISQNPHKNQNSHKTLIYTPNTLDRSIRSSYTVFSSITHGVLMSVSFLQAQKKKVRVTLEFDVFQDFNAKDIDFEKLFDLEPAETVEAYVEDFSI